VKFVPTVRPSKFFAAALGTAIVMSANAARAASNEAALLIEADTGKVLHAENARCRGTRPRLLR
jgi:D-alanyl-D-alanine carboxypeptidase